MLAYLSCLRHACTTCRFADLSLHPAPYCRECLNVDWTRQRQTPVSSSSGAMRRWRPCSLTIPLAVALSATTCIPGAVAFLSTPRMPVSGSGRVQLRPNGMLYGGRPWEQTTAVTGCSGLSRREVNRRTRPTGWKMGVGNVGEGNEGEGDAAGDAVVLAYVSLAELGGDFFAHIYQVPGTPVSAC